MRLRNLIILLASMLAVGFSIIFLLRDRKRSGIKADAELTYSRLATCLVGADARGKRFKESLADAQSREAIDPRGTDWPKRCRQYVDDAARAHDKAFDTGVIDADGSLTVVADALDKGLMPPEGPLDSLTKLWTSVPSEVPQPRARPPLAKVAALAPMHTVMPTAQIGDVDLAGSTLHVTLKANNDRDPPRVACDFDPKLESVTCAVPPVAPIFDVLARGRGVEPLYVKLDEETRSVVIDGKGTEIVRMPSYGYGFAFVDGRIAVLSKGGEGSADRLLFLREASGAVTTRSISGIADRFRSAGSWILWKESNPDDRTAPAKVRAFDLAASDGPLDLGPVERRSEGGTSTGDCRTDSHVFVDLSPALAVRDPEHGWSLVEEAPRPQYGNRTMTGAGDTVRIVDASNKGVTVQTCSAGGCTKKEVTVAVDPHDFHAVAVGSDVLLMWTQEHSLYALRGPLEKLPDAPVEELVHGDVPLDFAHAFVAPGIGFGGGPAPVQSVVPTPEGTVVFLMNHDAPTLYAIVVPPAGPARALVTH